MGSSTTYTTCQSALRAPTERIAGFTPAGMLDWPGRVAATVFLSGCDFRCPFCHNPGLNRSTSDPSQWDAVRSYLRMRRNWIDGVVITGGEPTDDPGLVALLDALAEESVPVKLDTNGSHPELLGRLIAERLVSYVAVDVKTTPENYESATGRADSAERVALAIDVIRESGIAHEFRTTVYPDVVELADLEAIAERLSGCELYALQQFRPDRTLDPRAGDVAPYHRDDLEAARVECERFLPTILRGV